VLAQICYPPTRGANFLTVLTVLLFAAASITHAVLTRGWRFASLLVVITAGGGFLVEALGVATGFPFGSYAYNDTLGPRLLGVSLIIPLAWTMMAWPAWLVAGRLVRGRVLRIVVAGWALASWDVFLDPQMVAAGHWVWAHPAPSLPGIPGVPLTNFAGWLAVSVLLMALLAAARPDNRGPIVQLDASAAQNCRTRPEFLPPPRRAGGGNVGLDVTTKDAPQHTHKRALPDISAAHTHKRALSDGPMLALYLWTYASSVLAHAVLLGLPASALAGAIAMGPIALPLAVQLVRAKA
jgi:putative membrane protein